MVMYMALLAFVLVCLLILLTRDTVYFSFCLDNFSCSYCHHILLIFRTYMLHLHLNYFLSAFFTLDCKILQICAQWWTTYFKK